MPMLVLTQTVIQDLKKIFWGGSFGYKCLVHFTWHTMQFYNDWHTRHVYIMLQSFITVMTPYHCIALIKAKRSYVWPILKQDCRTTVVNVSTIRKYLSGGFFLAFRSKPGQYVDNTLFWFDTHQHCFHTIHQTSQILSNFDV